MPDELKCKVAKEAATLLYFGAEKEYKQAKTRAAKTLGIHFLPSNLEVALELDKIAEENEGSQRKERLIQMRKDALKIMNILDSFRPKLVGSVWRGTIRRESDIDIAAYADDPQETLKLLKSNGVKVSRAVWTTVNKQGKTLASFHIYAESPAKQGIEVVVRSTEEAEQKRKCEIFGDVIKGLTSHELEKVLQENPTQKFIPA